MSRVAPFLAEPVQATPRGSMSPARRRAVSERQGGLCAVSGCCSAIVEIDHVRPLELGAPDTLANIQGLCKRHHLAKTAMVDLPAICKARALRKKAFPRIVRRRNIQQNQPCIEGTRVPASCIKSFHDNGYSVSEIITEYPGLNEAQVQAAIDYKPRKPIASPVSPWPKGRRLQSRGFGK